MTHNHQSWVDRHRPESFSDIQGNNSTVDEIKQWARDWSPGDEPQLLVGPPGTGKTSTVEVVANSLDLEVEEINASSARTTDDLHSMASSIKSTNAEGERRLILVDEVDSWHHGPQKRVLYDALDKPENPVMLTANEEYEVPDGIKSRANLHEFKLGVRSRKAKIKKVADAEDVDLEDHEIDSLAERPDLRSAINDLQMIAEQDAAPGADEREWEDSEWDILDQVLTGTPDIGSMSPADAVMWLDECVSAEYRGLEMSMAYEALSLADLSLARSRHTNDYSYWRHARSLCEEVARIRQTEPYYGDEVGYDVKSFPEWFRHKMPKATGEKSEAKLYRALKNYDGGPFKFSASYLEFLNVWLPLFKGLDDEEKYRMILSERLDPEEYEALGVTQSEYEDWAEVAEPEEGEWEGQTASATEW